MWPHELVRLGGAFGLGRPSFPGCDVIGLRRKQPLNWDTIQVIPLNITDKWFSTWRSHYENWFIISQLHWWCNRNRKWLNPAVRATQSESATSHYYKMWCSHLQSSCCCWLNVILLYEKMPEVPVFNCYHFDSKSFIILSLYFYSKSSD